MSHDLEIATHAEPVPEAVDEWLAERPLVVQGAFATEDGMWVRRRARRGQSVGFRIDGPFRVDLTDLSDPLRAAVLAPRWLLQLSTPVGVDDKDIALAQNLARFLARRFEGAVYDPQEDSILFSSAGSRRFRAARDEERASVLELLWVLPPCRDPEIAARFLEAARVLPEARPTRFGTFEPLQGRLSLDDDAPFVAQWSEELDVPWGGWFFWKATRPFFGGSANFPDWRLRKEKPRQVAQVTTIGIQVDSRALEQPAWRDAITDLFSTTALGVEAVYGAAYLQDGWIVSGSGLWPDAETLDAGKRDFIFNRNDWQGLPPAPSWLTWFGPAYRRKVEKALGDWAAILGTGLLLRVGDQPRPTVELSADYPELPDELLWRRLDDPSITWPDLPRAPAAWLPRL